MGGWFGLLIHGITVVFLKMTADGSRRIREHQALVKVVWMF
jgi:hypothetical protein